MTRFSGALALALAAVGVCVAAQDPAQRPTDSKSALITGRVVEGDGGQPVAAAVVALAPLGARAPAGPGGPIPAVLTDSEGRFFFNALEAGTYRLSAVKPGWIEGAYGRRRPGGSFFPLTLTDGAHRADLTIAIWRNATITGHVVDDTGDPLVGREVRAVSVTYDAGRRLATFAGRTQTDDRGVYRLSALMPGDYLIVAPATVTSEPATFSGTIRASGDLPHAYLQTMTDVASAQMSMDRADIATPGGKDVLMPMAGVPGTPPANGAWLTYPTTFYPSATTIDNATPVRAASGRARAGVDLTVPLTATYEISGVLMDAEGPAANHAVHLLPAESAEAPLMDVSTAVTDAGGVFTFYAVPPGQYVARTVRTPWPEGADWSMNIFGGTQALKTVGISGRGGPGPPVESAPLEAASAPVTVSDRSVRDLKLTLQPGARVRGRAVFEATKSPTAAELSTFVIMLAAASGRSDRALYQGRLTEDGRFASASTMAGRYVIRTGTPAGWALTSAMFQGRDLSDTPFDLSGDIDDVVLTFTDKPRTLTGGVQDGGSDLAVGATVVLFPTDSRLWTDYGTGSRRVQGVHVSPTGTFTLQVPPIGQYCIVAIPDDQSTNWRNPATLARLVTIAERLDVRDDQPIAQALKVRRLQ
jgi:hypothetical protein